NGAAVIPSTRGSEVLEHRCWKGFKFPGDSSKLVSNVIDIGHQHGVDIMAVRPRNALKVPGNRAVAPVAIHLHKEGLVANAAGILVDRRGREVGAEPIRYRELIVDARIA